MKSLDNKKTGFRKMTADDLRRGIDLSKSISGFKVIETKSNKKKTKEPDNKVWNGKNYDSVYFKFMKKLHPGWYPNENKPKELEWDRFVKENHTNFSKDANGIKYEFYEDDLLEFITQQRTELEQQKVKVVWNNVCEQIKKDTIEQILNLECLKEDKFRSVNQGLGCQNARQEIENQLREEIKEEIKKL